ncbi:MAG: GGDEF domain-containing protein [Phycisphaerales bacterium]
MPRERANQTPCFAKVLIVEAKPAIGALYAERLVSWGVVAEGPGEIDGVVCGTPGHGESCREMIGRLSGEFPGNPILAIVEPERAAAAEALESGAAGVLVRCPGYLEQLGCTLVGLLRRARAERLQATLREIQKENRTLRHLVKRLEDVASHDALTGLLNRRGLEGSLHALFNSAVRYGAELSCMVIDVDGLKAVNDRLGHRAGDGLLLAVAGTLRGACRKSDVIARIGGDEFVVLLPHTPARAAVGLRERIRAGFGAAARRMLTVADLNGVVPVGLSIGVASTASEDVEDAEGLLAAADRLMYAEKSAGRGRHAA